jgi:hypothetical protein
MTIEVPPLRFRPLVGPVREVDIRPCSYVRQHGQTLSQESGRRYEAQVQEFLQKRFLSYLPEPTVNFTDAGFYRSARPDGVLPFKDHVVVFEIKFTHVPEAWWQLEKLYKVVLDGLYHRPISLVEICRSYDPATPFPCPIELIPDLESWVSEHRPTFGVYQWRKTNL